MRTATEIYLELAECKRRESELLCELAEASAQPGEVVVKLPQRESSRKSSESQPKFKLARFRKGKFALMIWVSCKLKAIVRTDGGEVNMRDVANEIGACLGIHFTEEEWKSTLAGNFNVKEPRAFLWKMENEIWLRYLGRKKG